MADGKEEAGLDVEAAENMSRGTDCKSTSGVGLAAAAAAAAAGSEAETAASVSTEEIDSNSLEHKTSSLSSSSRSPAVISRSSISSESRLSTNRPQMQSTSSEVCHIVWHVKCVCRVCRYDQHCGFSIYVLVYLHLVTRLTYVLILFYFRKGGRERGRT